MGKRILIGAWLAVGLTGPARAEDRSAAPASVAIQKIAPAGVNVGTELKYQIVVQNTGGQAAQGVVVREALPANVRYVSSSPQAAVEANVLTWTLGDVSPGQTVTVSVVVVPLATGKVSNCVTCTAQACVETRVVQPKLVLTKTGPAEALRCDPIVYTLVVSNPGDGAATNVVITDTLPAGLATGDGSRQATYRVGTLAPGQSQTFTLGVAATQKGTYTNQAAASADHGLAAATQVSTVVREPRLVLTKTAPDRRFVGRPVHYVLTLANQGDGEARNTRLVDTLPAGLKFVSASGGAAVAGQQIAWNLGTLKPGESRSVEVVAQAVEIATVRNQAEATAYCAAARAEAATVIQGVPAILLEVIDIDDPVEVGAQTTYEIVVVNQGSAPGTNIVVRCTLPAEEELVSAEGPTAPSVAAKVVTFAPLASLAPKARATYRVKVKAAAEGDVRFTVHLTSEQMESPAYETESTHLYR